MALALAAATFLLAGCRSAAPEDSNVTLVTKTAQEATEAEEDPGASQTEEEMFVSGSNHVTTYVPSADEVARINALDWSAASQHMTPDATRAAGTVAHPTGIDPTTSQVFYLWEEDNMPGGDGYGYDDPGFMPAVTTVPVPSDTPVVGAVLLEAGGAFQFRGAQGDCYPTAEDLTARGYQCFVVDYRLSRDLGALDLARATRFVRAHWEEYGLPHADAIAVMGYSAGGIAAGQMLLDWDGTTSPALFDAAYDPDELDAVSADAAADGMIYSFYGRLSVASKDMAQLRAGNLPPTYFAFGTRDPFVSEFEANIAALEAAGVEVEGVVLQGWPHGFGAYGGWIDGYDAFLRRAFDAARND
ncbi:MAG: alpha/beta hydrolase [Atopobiaceae bacterium]|nr:alpha/beta hydrolase [Atopobiaceae bacterium]